MDEAVPIDLDHFTSFTNGDKQFECELSSLYVATASAYLEEMRQALAAGLPWDEPAHELKGASANMGAVEVAALAAKAEASAPSEAQLDRLVAALQAVHLFFERRTGADRSPEQLDPGAEGGSSSGAKP